MTIRNNINCEICTSDCYEAGSNADYSNDDITWTAIWTCNNCGNETPRITRNRATNKARALNAFDDIKRKWEGADEALRILEASGRIMGGALLVYCSSFNYHLDKLLMSKKLSNWDLKYHAERALEDLAKAQEYISEISGKQGENQ